MRPHILLFGTQGSGTSTSSPPGSSSSAKGSMNLDKGKHTPNNLAVKNLIEKIESGTEENLKKKEEMKKENQKKVMKNTKMKKKEDSNDLEDDIRMTNLQGLGPETRQGQSPTSSYLGSGDLDRAARSSAGTGMGEEKIRGMKVLD